MCLPFPRAMEAEVTRSRSMGGGTFSQSWIPARNLK